MPDSDVTVPRSAAAYAAPSAGKALEPVTIEIGASRPEDVVVRVSHCGVCGTDVHFLDNEYGVSTYPLVPGHEIVGTVIEVGSGVSGLSVGQRVGVSLYRQACFACDLCRSGQPNLCTKRVRTLDHDSGGFAELVRVDHRLAYPIPDSLPSEQAAPLLCAGATAYSALRTWYREGTRVGVVGIGGVGHLAIQYAAAMGARVTAFTSSQSKVDEARGFGAADVCSSTDPKELTALAGEFDLLIYTSDGLTLPKEYLGLLRNTGCLCMVSANPAPLRIPGFLLVAGQKTVAGRVTSSQQHMVEMLEFTAKHGIKAWVETMDISRANEALDMIKSGRPRYRVVLERSVSR